LLTTGLARGTTRPEGTVIPTAHVTLTAPSSKEMIAIRMGRASVLVFCMILCSLIISSFGGHGSATATSSSSKISMVSKKRILTELRDITSSSLTFATPFNTSDKDECGIRLSPMKRNLLEWHFSFTGMEQSVFEGGVYHGRIILHPDYPNRAPSISILTPNGRWEVNKDICLSATSYHQETWDSNWNLRTLVLSLRNFMITQPREIGSISSTPAKQLALAQHSRMYDCPICKASHSSLVLPSGISEGSVGGVPRSKIKVVSSTLADIDKLIQQTASGSIPAVATGITTRSQRRRERVGRKVQTGSKHGHHSLIGSRGLARILACLVGVMISTLFMANVQSHFV
jgi:ubiquitin-protein ligase